MLIIFFLLSDKGNFTEGSKHKNRKKLTYYFKRTIHLFMRQIDAEKLAKTLLISTFVFYTPEFGVVNLKNTHTVFIKKACRNADR